MGRHVSEELWVLATVGALRNPEVRSWTGRLHIHKTLFVAKILGMAKPPFRFDLYLYGPYSFDLDRKIAEMEAFGFLKKDYPRPGYGPQYDLPHRQSASQVKMLDSDRKALDRVAKVVGKMDSKRLELVATCLWVSKREKVRREDDVVSRTRQIKPQYSELQIRQAMKTAAEIETKLKQVA